MGPNSLTGDTVIPVEVLVDYACAPEGPAGACAYSWATLFHRRYREGFHPLRSSTWVSSWCSKMHRFCPLIGKKTFQFITTTGQKQ